MLIFENFSRHAYFRKGAYYRASTVGGKLSHKLLYSKSVTYFLLINPIDIYQDKIWPLAFDYNAREKKAWNGPVSNAFEIEFQFQVEILVQYENFFADSSH